MEPHSDHTILAVIGDLHGELYHLNKVLDHLGDQPIAGVVLVGDFGSPQYELARWKKDGARDLLLKEAERVLELVGRLELPIAWVPGNHDERDMDLPGNCDRRLADVAGVLVYGIGGSGPWRYGFPYEWEDDEVRALEIPPSDLVLSHAPPARTPLDWLFHGERHIGSEAVREIAEHHPGALVCGHIHEATGVVRIGDCLCMNVGSLGDPYGLMQVGYVVYSRSRKVVVELVHENLLTGKESRLAR